MRQANPCWSGARRDGSIQMIRAGGSNGIAVITWVAECSTKTGDKSVGGRRCADTWSKSSGTASHVISPAGPDSARPCSTGPTTGGDFETCSQPDPPRFPRPVRGSMRPAFRAGLAHAHRARPSRGAGRTRTETRWSRLPHLASAIGFSPADTGFLPKLTPTDPSPLCGRSTILARRRRGELRRSASVWPHQA